YKNGRKKRAIVNNILEQIKTEYHDVFDPDPSYEHKSIPSLYFGIDIKKGTALYIRLYPNKTLDVIGIDIDNFTRTVVRENCMEIHTKYVNMPMLELPIGVNSARSIANTLHAMASRGYDYPVDFPRLIQEKRKEWEQIAGMPVAEVF
ncbi:TPA: plasmid IncI1-type surface exclusion protein ExcA, partial [Escherichia coli]|nr:plasmid IncI1-type surface exclusion protein ExcA [Escherichia coli]